MSCDFSEPQSFTCHAQRLAATQRPLRVARMAGLLNIQEKPEMLICVSPELWMLAMNFFKKVEPCSS